MSQSDGVSPENDEKSSELSTTEESPYTDESQSRSVCVVSKPSNSIYASILIESLVKTICSLYESDRKKKSLMYNLICERLYDMSILSESYTMNEFESIRSQYQRAILNILASIKNNDTTLPVSPLWHQNGINSHYHQMFEEIEYIAGGGCGQVYKVKHKLDSTEYAVKKISIRSESIQSVENYLKEVKIVAILNHFNIVQYKGAWLEIAAPSSNRITIKDTEICESIKNVINTAHQTRPVQNYTALSLTEERREDTTHFYTDSEYYSVASCTKSQGMYSKRQKRRSMSGDGEQAGSCKLNLKQTEKNKAVNKTRGKWATLYIQMALCDSTLKQWLENRNSISNPDRAIVPANEHVIRVNTINQILIQLLKGLEYIHSKGVVHHDIKPSNIFVQIVNNTISFQLGDFGLACPLQKVRHSLAFGTELYAAPEQLEGKCNAKSDMYSLGIVLYELVENFTTDMERVRYITDLRKGCVPRNRFVKYSNIANMIEKLVVECPDNRPDATMLLNSLEPTESEILHLKELIKYSEEKKYVKCDNE